MKSWLGPVLVVCGCICGAGTAGAGNLWLRTLDTSAHRHDARSVVEAVDGGLVVVGYDTTLKVLTLTKLSATGVLEWQRVYKYGSLWVNPRRIIRTSDGGYAVAGDVSNARGIFLRFDSGGSLISQREYGVASSDFYDVGQTSDGGFILSGTTGDYDVGSGDAWLVKTDSAGNVSWSTVYGGLGSEEYARALQTSDGGYIVSAETQSFGATNGYLWVLKLTSSGVPVWQKQYGGAEWTVGWARQTADGGYLVSGYAGVEYMNQALLVRLTSSGNVTWAKTYAGSGYFESQAAPHPTECGDGGYLVSGTIQPAGSPYTDGWVMKTDETGNPFWQKAIRTSSNGSVRDGPIRTNSSGVAVAGGFGMGGSNESAIVARAASDGTIDPACGAVWQDAGTVAAAFTPVVTDTSSVATPVTLTAQVAGFTETSASLTPGEICTSPELADLAGSFTKLKKKGTKINATYACVNYGTVASGSFTVKVYLSKKTTVGPKSKVILTKVVGSLAPGGVASIKASGEKTSKTKYVVTVLDTTGAVPETDEANNKTVKLVP